MRLDLLAAILDASPTDGHIAYDFQFARKGTLNPRCIQGSPAIADLNISTPLSKCGILYFPYFVILSHMLYGSDETACVVKTMAVMRLLVW